MLVARYLPLLIPHVAAMQSRDIIAQAVIKKEPL
jgi:hypothetical protein